ncbi:dipeptide epimerase [Kordiimonas sediminis]|uniref:Dipeptide epimerase n=1 Tax=Kordiimonas sediminis TaxID=1735581 RepID=A0A919ASG6_9PROT|nr:N-acetyl-D-Glu racemase DgcA [Kordiimonas sediminis]GHF20586.1 dipeptide epimerase [Kordiimonas sediminis]
MLIAAHESWPIAGTFTISRGSKTAADVVVATFTKDGISGRGECVPYARYGESIDSVIAEIDAAAIKISADPCLVGEALKAGAARNAVDCAVWDWKAKQAGKRVWNMVGISAPDNIITAYTLSVDTPANMHAKALECQHMPLLKLKLAGDGDLERVEAVRKGAPNARIIVDANEGWNADHYRSFVPALEKLRIEAIEQPMPAGNDEALKTLARPIPIIADESCHDTASLSDIVGKYDMINIKLDKTGGLTEALALKEAAREAGLDIMVGCMVGTSLAMAPALLLAGDASIVDLDGPLLLQKDRPDGLSFTDNRIATFPPALWG